MCQCSSLFSTPQSPMRLAGFHRELNLKRSLKVWSNICSYVGLRQSMPFATNIRPYLELWKCITLVYTHTQVLSWSTGGILVWSKHRKQTFFLFSENFTSEKWKLDNINLDYLAFYRLKCYFKSEINLKRCLLRDFPNKRIPNFSNTRFIHVIADIMFRGNP